MPGFLNILSCRQVGRSPQDPGLLLRAHRRGALRERGPSFIHSIKPQMSLKPLLCARRPGRRKKGTKRGGVEGRELAKGTAGAKALRWESLRQL